jgi:hypothetical protein
MIYDDRTLEILIKLGGHFTTDDGHIRIMLMNDVEAPLWQAVYAGRCRPCSLRREIAAWPDEPEFAHYRLTETELAAIPISRPWLPLADMAEVMDFLTHHAGCQPPPAIWPR